MVIDFLKTQAEKNEFSEVGVPVSGVYACPICGRAFASKEGLTNHANKNHISKKTE